MKRTEKWIIMLILLTVLFPSPALADGLVYTFHENEGAFGVPTSTNEKELVTESVVNHNRSKSAAYIPPLFGSMTSYTLHHMERLTPNLLDESDLKETTGIIRLEDTVYGEAVFNDGSAHLNSVPIWSNTGNEAQYTALTDAFYYTAGHIGRLSIPEIDLSVKVYEGATAGNMKKGAAHIKQTSFWDGNVVLCGHNRGDSDYFKDIHKLEAGDLICYTTKLGEKWYRVDRVSKVHEANYSVLLPSANDELTLLTCVRNESEYRYAVKATCINS